MRVKIAAYTILIFSMTLIQSTVLDNIRVYNIKPNLLMVLIVTSAFLSGNIEGAVVGFFCGLSQDMVSGKTIGLYALLGLYLGYSVGSINDRLYRENALITVLITFVSTIVYEFSVYFLNWFYRGNMDFVFPFTRVILPEALYNGIASVFIFIIVLKVKRKSEKSGKLSSRH